MTYQHSGDLHLTYSPNRGYWNFVLYIEPPGDAGSALNAGQNVKTPSSRYAAEWTGRLVRCDPDALHVTLVGKNDTPRLWHPCVYEDTDSPSAISGDGCVCWQAFRDPLTWLPVAAQHFRAVSGNIEHWTHYTYAPLEITDGARLDRLIIDREAEMMWLRTDGGVLHLLPEVAGAGYGSGYGGSGPTELAGWIEKIVASDGYDISAGTGDQQPGKRVQDWASSKDADHTQELTFQQLQSLCHTGTPR